jgi:hypothetical protein
MPTYQWPTSAELRTIDQQFMARMVADDPIFRLFPIRPTQGYLVTWEQRDNYLGLQQIRGMNGDPPSVPSPGSKRYVKRPGVYGEFAAIDEMEITTRAAFGTWASVVNIDDLVVERQNLLMTREVNRMRWVLWTLLTTGVYTVLDNKGAIVDQDFYVPQRFTSTVPWATTATATPLADFRAVQILNRGQSVSFGPSAMAMMNQQTFNYLIANTNQADLGGRRTEGLASIEGLADLNRLQMRDGLPTISINDDGYYDDLGVFRLWLPDNTVVVIGTRTNGSAVGEMLQTRNASNPDLSSEPYVKVIDRGAARDEPPPRRIEVHRGVNMGPALYYPGSIVIMSV